jgi:hypothetical protein
MKDYKLKLRDQVYVSLIHWVGRGTENDGSIVHKMSVENRMYFMNRGFVYYESIKRELKIKPIHECRCDDRLQTKTKRFTRLSCTGLVVELEHKDKDEVNKRDWLLVDSPLTEPGLRSVLDRGTNP